MIKTYQEAVDNFLAIKKYQPIGIFSVRDFLSLPINILYEKIKTVYRPRYEIFQRIVIVDCVDSTVNKQPFYNYLQRILVHLDITNCFVLILGNNISTKDFLVTAYQQFGLHDKTTIEFEKINAEIEYISNQTDFDIPDSVCINPWINIELKTNGKINPCCEYRSLDINTSINDTSMLDLINSDQIIQLRNRMRSGEYVPECGRCWANESAGKKSKRMRDNYVFRDEVFKIDWNNTTQSKLISLDIKLKNICNLSCRICNPYNSSKWYDEVFQNQDVYPMYKLQTVKFDWRTDIAEQQLWEDFTKVAENVKYITFSGGEPLLDKNHLKLLQYFIDHGLSKDIYLHYNTNGTIYAEHLIKYWNQFKTVELSFSIDNVKEKFEYERFGSTWDVVVNTIKKYQELNIRTYIFNIFATVSSINILDIYDVYTFSKECNLPVVFNNLIEPEPLNLGIFNKTQKEYVNNKLKSIDNLEFRELVDPVCNFMNNCKVDLTGDDLVKFLQTTDKIRKQDYRLVYPELHKILNGGI